MNTAAFTPAGAPEASYAAATVTLPNVAPHVGVVASDEGALVVWEESANIRGVLLAAGGKPDGQPIVIASTSADEQHPVALALGLGRYLIAYEINDGGQTRLATRLLLTASPARPRPTR